MASTLSSLTDRVYVTPMLHSGGEHGRVAIVTAAGERLTAANIGAQPSTFECVDTRILSRQSTCLVVRLYRTGPVTANFFQLSGVLDRLSTYVDPIILAEDVNFSF